MNHAARRTWPATFGYLAILTMLLWGTLVQGVRGDPASCLVQVASYVAELDKLLGKEKNWITPFVDLNKRYTPFQDCDADTLLIETMQSRFRRPITYNPRLKEYYVVFASSDVKVGFVYLAAEKRSETHFAGWVNK